MSGKIKRKNIKIPKGSAVIKPHVAELPETNENEYFSIGFRYFRDDLCVLKEVDPKISRKVHEIYRNLGRCSSVPDVRNLPHGIKMIVNSGHYAKYYSGLTEDTEMCEFDIGACRGFFFFDQSNKLVQMVAIDRHPEYKKNKR